MSDALSGILGHVRARVAGLAADRPALEAGARRAARPRAWAPVFSADTVGIIAEVKRRSPSHGVIASDLDPVTHARAYHQGGAVAISVLTEERFFGGSLMDLGAVCSAVPLPVLRKDFIIDPLQLYESRVAGASAVLLIVRALDPGHLVDLSATAADLGLARLVEVHSMTELERAVALAPEAIGVNARDLETLTVDLAGIAPVLRAIPEGIVAVAESGITSRGDVERVAAWGADAILVGTAFAGAPDPATAVRRLAGVTRSGRAGPREPMGGTRSDR